MFVSSVSRSYLWTINTYRVGQNLHFEPQSRSEGVETVNGQTFLVLTLRRMSGTSDLLTKTSTNNNDEAVPGVQQPSQWPGLMMCLQDKLF